MLAWIRKLFHRHEWRYMTISGSGFNFKTMKIITAPTEEFEICLKCKERRPWPRSS